MSALGHAILIIGLVVCVYGAAASVYGIRANKPDWVVSGRRAVYALAAIMIIAFALLEDAFITNNFHFRVVSSSSSSTIPLFYRMAAPWSSQQGSLLLWVTLLSIWSSVVLFITRKRMRDIAPYATATLLGLGAFFDALAVFAANPFDTLPASQVPTQGTGLDPLLMHPSMIIHPPMLYTGYTLMAIPFAFAVGALISGNLSAEWIRDTRKFALAAWLALGTGIVLGARWSYTELGWGGYWGWDAVENAALMPWLIATAYIHSIQIQEKKGMLKIWNVSLILLSGVLTIFGTFLVRSGVLDSIHAFGASTLGIPFIALLAFLFLGGIGLVLWRSERLRSDHHLDSLLSREAMFLLQNMVFVFLVFVIFFLTVLPLVSKFINGFSLSAGPPLFGDFVVPLALVLVLLTGIGPMISWRRASVANLQRNFLYPALFGVLVMILAATLAGAGSKPVPLLMFGLAAFVIAGVVQEIHRGTMVRRSLTHDPYPTAMAALFRRNRRRYGGYTVHMGFAVLMVGVAASSSFQHSTTVTLAPGQSANLDGMKFMYAKPTETATAERISLGAQLIITKHGRHVSTLNTARGIYPSQDESTDGIVGRFFDTSNADTTVGLDSGALRDIWTVVQAGPTPAMTKDINEGNSQLLGLLKTLLAKTKGQGTAAQNAAINNDPLVDGLTFYELRDRIVTGIASQYTQHPVPIQFLLEVSPLVTWLWAGAIIMFGGGLIAIWPAPFAARRRELALYRTRLARELS